MDEGKLHEFIGATKKSIENIEKNNSDDFREVKDGIKSISDKLQEPVVCPFQNEIEHCSDTRITTKDRRYIIGAITVLFGITGVLFKYMRDNSHDIIKYLKP